MMNLIILIILFFMIGVIFLFLNILISKKYFNLRVKNSSFECGFDSMLSSRLPFSINFYLIGILFLIFDVEVVLLLPLIISLNLLVFNKWIYSSLMIMLILYLGLEYEKIQGSLKWFF